MRTTETLDPPQLTARQVYRRLLQRLRRERGGVCEVCKVPARSFHHIAPVAQTGITSALVTDPRNLLLICDDCHTLMHPGQRRYPWFTLRQLRHRAMA